MASSTNTPGSESSALGALPRRSFTFSTILGILLILSGVLAILLPVEMSLGVIIVVCWLLMISGVVQVVDAFRDALGWHTAWKIAVALAFFTTGLFLRFHLGIGIVALSVALIVFFVAQGLIDMFIYFRTRESGASGWLLLHGVVSFILGIMIWRHWPSGSLYVAGTIVGINMIVTGTTRLMLTAAARKLEEMTV